MSPPLPRWLRIGLGRWRHWRGAVQLEAYDPLALGAPIIAANAGDWKAQGNSFVTPLEANGRVHVVACKTVTVFGPGQ